MGALLDHFFKNKSQTEEKDTIYHHFLKPVDVDKYNSNVKNPFVDVVPNKQQNILNRTLTRSNEVKQQINRAVINDQITQTNLEANRRDKPHHHILTGSYKKQTILREFGSQLRLKQVVDVKDWQNHHHHTYIYHYTSFRNARNILRDKMIRVFHNERFQKFGNGVFLSVMDPMEEDDPLMVNHFKYPSYKYLERLQCVFAFRISDLSPKPIKMNDWTGRDVWKFHKEINLSSVEYCLVIRDS